MTDDILIAQFAPTDHALEDLRSLVDDVLRQYSSDRIPNTIIVPYHVVRTTDRALIRQGFMPLTAEGRKYAKRRRRMARKKRRGYA